MQTQTTYEDMALKELREIPKESLPEVIKVIKCLKQSIIIAQPRKQTAHHESGFCGAWKDDRNAEEIIKDIHTHRTGFANRNIIAACSLVTDATLATNNTNHFGRIQGLKLENWR